MRLRMIIIVLLRVEDGGEEEGLYDAGGHVRRRPRLLGAGGAWAVMKGDQHIWRRASLRQCPRLPEAAPRLPMI